MGLLKASDIDQNSWEHTVSEELNKNNDELEHGTHGEWEYDLSSEKPRLKLTQYKPK